MLARGDVGPHPLSSREDLRTASTYFGGEDECGIVGKMVGVCLVVARGVGLAVELLEEAANAGVHSDVGGNLRFVEIRHVNQ